MAKLYFKHGVMGSSKTANALMARFNYEERGQRVLMAKPRTDTRDGEHKICSRIGLGAECMYMDELRAIPREELLSYDCIIVDEAQFLTKEEVYWLSDIVDEPDGHTAVLCYGLRADFQGNLFEGSTHLLALADKIEEVKTTCWCGKKATQNARFDSDGKIVRQGEQIVIGANDQYVSLCRRHWKLGQLGPEKE